MSEREREWAKRVNGAHNSCLMLNVPWQVTSLAYVTRRFTFRKIFYYLVNYYPNSHFSRFLFILASMKTKCRTAKKSLGKYGDFFACAIVMMIEHFSLILGEHLCVRVCVWVCAMEHLYQFLNIGWWIGILYMYGHTYIYH